MVHNENGTHPVTAFIPFFIQISVQITHSKYIRKEESRIHFSGRPIKRVFFLIAVHTHTVFDHYVVIVTILN